MEPVPFWLPDLAGRHPEGNAHLGLRHGRAGDDLPGKTEMLFEDGLKPRGGETQGLGSGGAEQDELLLREDIRPFQRG
jgi:hypothetical protein